MTDDGIEKVRAAMAAEEEVDLPEGMELPQDAYDGDPADSYPEGYLPPPPPPDDRDGQGDDETPDPVAVAAAEPLNDIGNARRFVVHFGKDVHYVSQVGWHLL